MVPGRLSGDPWVVAQDHLDIEPERHEACAAAASLYDSDLLVSQRQDDGRIEAPELRTTGNTIKTGVPFTLSGQAWLGQPGGDWLPARPGTEAGGFPRP